MSNTFDFETFKANAIEQLKAGVPIFLGNDISVYTCYVERSRDIFKKILQLTSFGCNLIAVWATARKMTVSVNTYIVPKNNYRLWLRCNLSQRTVPDLQCNIHIAPLAFNVVGIEHFCILSFQDAALAAWLAIVQAFPGFLDISQPLFFGWVVYFWLLHISFLVWGSRENFLK